MTGCPTRATASGHGPDRAFILCAGLGTRLRPHTDTIPKPMVPVAGVPILGHILNRLRDAGVRQVAINTHYRPESIRAYAASRTDIKITLLHEDTLRDTGGGVKGGLSLLGNTPFYVINGDALWTDGPNQSVLGDLATAFHPETMDLLLGLAPIQPPSGAVAVGGDYMMGDDGRCQRTPDKTGSFMFSGIRIARPALFDHSPDGAFSFLWLMDRAQQAGRLFGRPLHGTWHHISTPADLERTHAEWTDRPRIGS